MILVNQLLAIAHEIFSSFDDTYEVRVLFLDISRTFDVSRYFKCGTRASFINLNATGKFQEIY